MSMRHTRARRLRDAVGLLFGFLAATAANAMTPDLSGPWIASMPGKPLVTENGAAPPLLLAARAGQAKTMITYRTQPGIDPLRDCLPPGVPRLMQQPMPFDIVQGKRSIGMLFQWNHLTRIIYMDRAHFEPIGPLYLGQSIGKWDGDTLVVDTNSFNAITWLDDYGLPHSDKLTVIERLRRLPNGMLEDRITFTDPATYARPWTARLTFRKTPGVIVREDYCLGRTPAATK
jgi:hypothetical protein